jgi:type IV pilus assembly protein PilY1
MFKPTLKAILLLCVTTAMLVTSYAEVSQEPLLTRSGVAVPNLLLMFDDSGSMDDQYVYQYGGTQGGDGRTGPGAQRISATCPSTLSITDTCTYNAPAISAISTTTTAIVSTTWVSGTTYVQGDIVKSTDNNYYQRTSRNYSKSDTRTQRPQDNNNLWNDYQPPRPVADNNPYYALSPDVNRLYYDPRITYRVRVDSAGVAVASAPVTTAAFYVYFYKSGTTDTMVWPGTGNDPLLLTSYLSPYTPASAALATGATAGLSYPNAVATGNGPFPKFLKRTDCNGGAAGGSCSLAEERQNYANWKKYHSNRLDLVKTGLGYAFKNIKDTIRLGWSTINGLEGNSLDAGVSLFDTARKTAFYSWLYRQQNPGNTPNRIALNAAGSYFSRSDNKGPWASTPDVSSTGTLTLSNADAGDTTAIRKAHLACRRSYSMLVTDGYYNDDNVTFDSFDSTSAGPITGTTALGAALTYSYNGTTRPYAQTQANTMADVAMEYWITDLRPDIDNKVRVIPSTVVNGVTTTVGNESFWQNMTFYGVALGVNGTLPQNATTLFNLTQTGTGRIDWPTVTRNTETAIDDMWHATINTRGRLLSAKNADELSDAVEGMLAEINKQSSSQSGVAVSTANLVSGTRKYTPRYETGSWKGNVIAHNLDANTGRETSLAWQIVGTAVVGTSVVAFNGIPSPAARTIVAWNGTQAENFVNTTAITGSMTAPVTTDLINYIRGDQSNEGVSGLGLYRPRQVVLGDIVNSSPAFIKDGVDMKYDTLPSTPTTGSNTYRNFYNWKAARAEGAVFVGANDGMLHAFRESTGQEVFAYIPRAVLPNIHLLAAKNYTHRYFVDGPNIETDAYTATGWKNILLGTTGAGAKAVYAIDVSSPTNLSATSVLWDVNNTSSSDFSELGYVTSDVQAGKTPSGDWVAMFGNGYDSASGKARLYIVNLLTGAYIKHFEVSTTTGNGLSAVRAVRNANQEIIGAYAGDLQGKMWKFDLSSAFSSGWQMGNGGNPIFDAGANKPITASPVVVRYPLSPYGNIVAFATGKLLETTDLNTTAVQSVYGILDTVPFGSPSSSITVGTANLVLQTITPSVSHTYTLTSAGVTTTQTVDYFKTSNNTVTFNATVKGWYINLSNAGERVVYPVGMLGDRFISVESIAPNSAASTVACTQAEQAKAWLYFFDSISGGGPAIPIMDTDGDGDIDASDGLSNGTSSTADGRNLLTKVTSRSNETHTTYVSLGGTDDTPQDDPPCTGVGCSITPPCTVNCGPPPPTQEINCATSLAALTGAGCNPTTHNIQREWRQLFMR